MKKVDIENLNTENKFLVDWLSFTSKIHSPESIIDFLGLNRIIFEEIYGCQGYHNRKYFDGINIHYNSERNEGIWLEMSGQGCRNFETYSNLSFYDLFINIISDSDSYHVTRLDVAYDDFSGVIPLRKLSKQILKNHFVSKFHSNSCTVTQASGFQGITCNLGSCRSDVRFRVYDKAFERGYIEDIQNGFSWTRWEIQMRDDNALNFIRSSIEQSVGDVFKGVLLNYFRVCDMNKSDSNKRRWNTSKWYRKFIGEVEKVSLFTKCEADYNLFKCENYVYHQSGNAIDTLIKIKGKDVFLEELRKFKSETSLKYKELYNKYVVDSEHKKISDEISSLENDWINLDNNIKIDPETGEVLEELQCEKKK